MKKNSRKSNQSIIKINGVWEKLKQPMLSIIRLSEGREWNRKYIEEMAEVRLTYT
jgi:hypothetical protein